MLNDINNASTLSIDFWIKGKIDSGEFPNVKFTCVLKEGIPEEEILKFAKNNSPGIIVTEEIGEVSTHPNNDLTL